MPQRELLPKPPLALRPAEFFGASVAIFHVGGQEVSKLSANQERDERYHRDETEPVGAAAHLTLRFLM